MRKSVDALCKFVVTRGEPAKLFKSIEESLDGVTMQVDFALHEVIISGCIYGLLVASIASRVAPPTYYRP